MKQYIAILLIAVFGVSCAKKETMDSTFRMEVKGYVEEECFTLGEEQSIYLWASKSWADNQMSAVEYRVDPTLLENYNAEEGTSLKLLPDSCYRMEQTEFSVGDEDEFAKFKMKFTPEKVIAGGGKYNEVEYALPLRLWVNGIPQDERYGSVIVGFLINPAYFQIYNAPELKVYTRDLKKVYEQPIVFGTNYNNKEWIHLKFMLDMSLVDTYNAENGTDYLPLPNVEKVVTWLEEEGELERDVNQDSLSFYIDMALSGIEEGDMHNYLLPIRLAEISSKRAKLDNPVRYFLWQAPRVIPQKMWIASATSSRGGTADKLLDGDTGQGDDHSWTWDWNNYSNHASQYITFQMNDLKRLAVVEKLEVYPRKQGAWKGPKTMRVEATTDLETWDVVQDFNPPLDPDGTVMTGHYDLVFDKPLECVAFRIRFQEVYPKGEGGDGIGFTEIYMHGETKENPNPPVLKKIPQNMWTVTTTTSKGDAGKINNDNVQDWWLWDWSKYNSLSPENPEDVTFTLKDTGKTATIEKLEVHAYRGSNGGWKGPKDMLVQVQKTEGGEWETVKNYTAEEITASPTQYNIVLDSPVDCKAIRLRITSGYSNGIFFSEIYMHGSLSDK